MNDLDKTDIQKFEKNLIFGYVCVCGWWVGGGEEATAYFGRFSVVVVMVIPGAPKPILAIEASFENIYRGLQYAQYPADHRADLQ